MKYILFLLFPIGLFAQKATIVKDGSDYKILETNGTLSGSMIFSGGNISGFTNDAGYLTSEVDGSTTNEIQTLSLVGTTLGISSSATTVQVDPSITNEAQTLSYASGTLTLSAANGSGGGSVSLDNYSSWSVDTDANSPLGIGSGTELTFAGGTDITTSRSGATVTIAYTGSGGSNVYTANGTITSDRTLTLGTNQFYINGTNNSLWFHPAFSRMTYSTRMIDIDGTDILLDAGTLNYTFSDTGIGIGGDKGSSGEVLTSKGTSSAPAWQYPEQNKVFSGFVTSATVTPTNFAPVMLASNISTATLTLTSFSSGDYKEIWATGSATVNVQPEAGSSLYINNSLYSNGSPYTMVIGSKMEIIHNGSDYYGVVF